MTVNRLNEDNENYDTDALIRNYQSGTAARMCHINAGLDVLRPAKMTAIDEAFRKSNVVVIHGASGQGKSTIAYRYLHDCCPLAYEIKNCSVENVDKIITTLSALIKGLSCNITFYIDVEPTNTEWTKILARFGELQKVQCIVTIRQEDMNQQRHILDRTIRYSEVGLELTKEEAEDIYNQVTLTKKFKLPFAKVWDEAGKHGTMLEFMYHLTHGVSLRARLAEQVDKISGSKRKLLAYIIVGNYLGGNINKEDLSSLDEIDVLEVEEFLYHWIDEFYSIKADGSLTDIHPIRTKIVLDELFQDNIKAKMQYGLELYKNVQANHVDNYLIRLLIEGMSPDDLIQWANKQSDLSPVHCYGICKALYWSGIQEFLRSHENLIEELKDRVGELWSYYLPVNFTEIDVNKSLKQMVDQLNPDLPNVDDIVTRFSDQKTIFRHMENWLNGKTLHLNIKSGNDWVKTGLLLYYLSQIGFKDVELDGSTKGIVFLDLQDMATVLLGLKSIPLSDYVDDFEDKFVRKLRQTYHIVRFERTDQELYVKSFLDYFSTEDDTQRRGFITEHQNMQILDLCRRAFPNEKNYHAEIMNDFLTGSFGNIPLEKNIAKANLPLEEMREPRKILTNLYKRSYCPEDRTQYAQNVLEQRDAWTKIMFRIANALEKWSIDKQKFHGLQEAYKEAISLYQSKTVLVPQSEISEYGFTEVEDPVSKMVSPDITNNKQEFELLHKQVSTYFNNLTGFIQQSLRVLTGDKQRAMASLSCLYEAFEGLYKMRDMFRMKLSDYVPDIDIPELEKKEISNMKLIWTLWEQYIKNSDERLDFRLLLKRYEDKEKSFAKDLLIRANVYLQEYLAIGYAEPYGDKIRITYTYVDEDSKESGMDECIATLKNELNNYSYYSSERLILKQVYQAVWLNPIFASQGIYTPNMDNHYTAISIDSLFGNSKEESELYRYPAWDVDCSMYDLGPKLEYYSILMQHLMLVIISIQKLLLANEELSEDDRDGKEVVNRYASLCKQRIEKDCENFDADDMLSNLMVGKDDCDTLIRDVVSCLDYFYKKTLRLDDWWKNSSTIVESISQLLAQDQHVKMSLAEAE